MSVDRGKKPRKHDTPRWTDQADGWTGRPGDSWRSDQGAMVPAELGSDDVITIRRRVPLPLREPDAPTPFDDHPTLAALAEYYRRASESLEDHGHCLNADCGFNAGAPADLIEGDPVDLQNCPEACLVARRLATALVTLLRFERGQRVPEWRGSRDAWLLQAGNSYAELVMLVRADRAARDGLQRQEVGKKQADERNESQIEKSNAAAKVYLKRVGENWRFRREAAELRDSVAKTNGFKDRKTIENALKRLAGERVGRKVRALAEAHEILLGSG